MSTKLNLCLTCRNYEYAEFKNGKTRSFCAAFNTRITSGATRCRSYTDRERYEYENMAWVLEKKVKVGFDEPVMEFNKPKPDTI